MTELGFPRLYEDGTLTVCRSIKGVHRPKSQGGRALGKRKKTFALNSRKKRTIRSSAIRQFITRKRKILFCTLTFPKTVTHEYANKCFSKYVENLSKNYALKSYVCVKENHESGNPHFHCLFDIPFQDFKLLNKAWNHTFNDRFKFSPNAFTTGRRKFAEDIRQVGSYITKYITKAEFRNISNEELIKLSWQELLKIEIEYIKYQKLIATRTYFISENVLSRPQIISENNMIYLITRFEHKVFFSDQYTIYFLKDFADLPENYQLSLEKKVKKPKIIPDAMPINLDF